MLPMVASKIFVPTNGRIKGLLNQHDRYTSHEETAPREVGPSGRTLAVKLFQPFRRSQHHAFALHLHQPFALQLG
jgi:hypothetical protein